MLLHQLETTQFTKLICYGVGASGQVTGGAEFEFNGASGAKDVEHLIKAAPLLLRELQSIYDFMIDRGEDPESDGMIAAHTAIQRALGKTDA